MKLSFTTIPHEPWESWLTHKLLQQSRFLNHLRPAHVELLKLHCNLLASKYVKPQVDFSERPRSDLFTHLEAIRNSYLVMKLFLRIVCRARLTRLLKLRRHNYKELI